STNPTREIVTFLIIPIALVLVSQLLLNLKGSYYLGQNFDPDYAYLFNSINLIQRAPPGHIDHPGTSMQMFGAVFILAKYSFARLFGGADSLQYDVLTRPEEYLRFINLALVLILAITVFIGGMLIKKYYSDRKLGLLFQISPFMFSTLLLSTTRVTPEPLLLILAMWISIILMPVLSNGNNCQLSYRKTILMGLLIGIGIAAKVTFIPLVLLIVLLRDFRKILVGLLSILISFIVFTIPIIAQYDRLFEWLRNLVTHDGIYGGGALGLPDVAVLWNNFLQLIRSEPLFFVLILSLYFCLFVFVFREKGTLQNNKSNHYIWIIFVIALLFTGHTLITVKHPPIHYMLPSITFSGMILVGVGNFRKRPDITEKLKKVLSIYIILFVSASGIFSLWRTVKEIQSVRNYNDETAQIENLIKTEFENCFIADFYRSSSMTFALTFGNDFSRYRFGNVLRELYPNSMAYEKWGNYFYRFGDKIEDDEITRILEDGSCVLMRGSPIPESNLKNIIANIERIDSGTQLALYRVISIK
ncbi:MAG: hypothetical protein MUO76_03045, partial [Anaerolineaceae bacterium]|nr:hypothetical protein [Anaerolineaceae bacterium]